MDLIHGNAELPTSQTTENDVQNTEVSDSNKPIDSDQSHSERSESKNSNSDASDSRHSDMEAGSKSPGSKHSQRSQLILQPPASYQALEQSPDNSDSSNNPTIESSQNNSYSDNSQIVPNTVNDQLTNDNQPGDQLNDQPDDEINNQPDEQLHDQLDEIDQNDNLPSPPTTPSDDTISSEPPKSCLSRRCSSKSSIKKKVNYSDSKEYIPSLDDALLPMATDDDEVFSDSISPQLPRGDMCTPYPKKKGSIPGLSFPSDWFPDDR